LKVLMVEVKVKACFDPISITIMLKIHRERSEQEKKTET